MLIGALTTPRVRSLVEAPLILVKSSLVEAPLILVKSSLVEAPLILVKSLTICVVVSKQAANELCVDYILFPCFSLLSSTRVWVVAVVVAVSSTKETPEEFLVWIFLSIPPSPPITALIVAGWKEEFLVSILAKLSLSLSSSAAVGVASSSS
jgi:hypothetical protein